MHSVLKRYMRQCLWSGAGAAAPSTHPHPASALLVGGRGCGQQPGPLPSHVPLLALYASFLPAADRRAVLSEYFEGACVGCVWGWWGLGVGCVGGWWVGGVGMGGVKYIYNYSI